MLLSERNAPHAKRKFSRKGDGELRALGQYSLAERPVPMMTATNIHYEQANRVRGLSAGGIGATFKWF